MIKTFAVITAGLVTNLIEIDDVDTVSIGAFGAVVVPSGITAAIGWGHDGVNFSTPATIPLTLAQAKVKQLAIIEAAYSSANQKPIVHLTFTFQADNASTDLMASVIATLSAVSGTSIQWWDASNTSRTLTYAEFAGLCAAILARGQTLFVHMQAKKALIRAVAADTNAKVEAIVW